MTQTDKSTLPKDFAEPPHWVHKQRACRTSPNDDEAPMTAEKKKDKKKGVGVVSGILRGVLALVVVGGLVAGGLLLAETPLIWSSTRFEIPPPQKPRLGHMVPQTPGANGDSGDRGKGGSASGRKSAQAGGGSKTEGKVGGASALSAGLDGLPSSPKEMQKLVEAQRRAQEKALRRQRIAKEFPLYAAAYPEYDLRLLHARVYDKPGAKTKVIGYLRRGTLVRAKKAVAGGGCPSGRWHPIEGNGYICTTLGYEVGKTPPKIHHKQRQPEITKAVPLDYYKPKENGAPLLRRLPKKSELVRVDKARKKQAVWPKDMLYKRMVGYYRISGDRIEKVGDRNYLRTVQGHYIRLSDLEPVPDPPMKGVHLGSLSRLPMAFVYGKEQRPSYRFKGGKLVESTSLPKHTRFHVDRVFKRGKNTYVSAPNGVVLLRDHVRIAEKITPPKKVGKGDKWIHVALGQQTLVAYKGEKPIFVTLVSSGMKGYRPPRGTFYVHKKYITVTMSGKDPKEGAYRVEDVPWTMYYWNSYAVHGAYWHNDFGIARSHGCTNISPPDAKWLYAWSDPEVPPRWHARIRARGTWVHYTK